MIQFNKYLANKRERADLFLIFKNFNISTKKFCIIYIWEKKIDDLFRNILCSKKILRFYKLIKQVELVLNGFFSHFSQKQNSRKYEAKQSETSASSATQSHTMTSPSILSTIYNLGKLVRS